MSRRPGDGGGGERGRFGELDVDAVPGAGAPREPHDVDPGPAKLDVRLRVTGVQRVDVACYGVGGRSGRASGPGTRTRT